MVFFLSFFIFSIFYFFHLLGIFKRSNTSAWMNQDLFIEWLDFFNQKIENRNVILILDNFSSHKVDGFNNIKRVFLPPNSTSNLQPLDKGIIKNLKDRYKKELGDYYLNLLYMKKKSKYPSIAESIIWCISAFNEITINCIQSS